MLPIPGVSKLEMYGVIAVILLVLVGGAYGYYEWSRAKIDGLKAEVAEQKLRADTLDADVKILKNQMEIVQKATDEANRGIASARDAAAQASRAIRAQNLTSDANNNAAAIEAATNKSLNDAFRTIETSTRPAGTTK